MSLRTPTSRPLALVHDLKAAGDIVRDSVREAEVEIARLANLAAR